MQFNLNDAVNIMKLSDDKTNQTKKGESIIMKKLTAFILAAVMLFSLCASVPVSALDTDVPPESEAQEIDGQEPVAGVEEEPADENNPEPGDVSETEEEPEEQEYYYITQEEFEKYRDDYFNELTTEKLFGAIGAEGLYALGCMLMPLAIPLVIFIPFVGALATGVALFAPVQGILSFAETFTGAFYIMFHRNELYNDFSTDRLYAHAQYELNEETDEYEFTGYEILYKNPEEDATLWSDCLPVAIKNS